jgi:hypothetical protein
MEPPNTAAAAGAPAGDAQVAALHATFAAAGQGHVTEALAQLGPGPEKEAMLAQLATIDPARCNDLFKRATTLEPAKGGVFSPLTDIAPVEGTGAERKRWRRMGLNEVAAGRVGTLLLAGGQGTVRIHARARYELCLLSVAVLPMWLMACCCYCCCCCCCCCCGCCGCCGHCRAPCSSGSSSSSAPGL